VLIKSIVCLQENPYYTGTFIQDIVHISLDFREYGVIQGSMLVWSHGYAVFSVCQDTDPPAI
jgi:hypothetical protein